MAERTRPQAKATLAEAKAQEASASSQAAKARMGSLEAQLREAKAEAEKLQQEKLQLQAAVRQWSGYTRALGLHRPCLTCAAAPGQAAVWARAALLMHLAAVRRVPCARRARAAAAAPLSAPGRGLRA